MSTDENAQLEAAVKYLRRPYMDHPGWGAELEDLLRNTIIKDEDEKFLERPFSGEFTQGDKAALHRLFGKYNKRHAEIMRVMNEITKPYNELTEKYPNPFEVWNLEVQEKDNGSI